MLLHLYRNAAGEHVPAWRLTPAEAVAVRDEIRAVDLPYLTDDALRAVQATAGVTFRVHRSPRGEVFVFGTVPSRKAA
jgi:hypothetical protein